MTTHYFTADFAGQTLGMGLPACRPLQDLPTGHITLDAAAALGYAERWLPELEAWLAHGLFPSLCPQQPNWGDHWVLTRAPSPHVGGRDAAQIHLPWLALEKLKTPLPGWTWQTAHCPLILDSFDLPSQELIDIDIGALIVLPSSFAPTWRACIGPDHLYYTAQLQKMNGQLQLQTQAQAQAQMAPAVPTHHTTVRTHCATLNPCVRGREEAGSPLHFELDFKAPILLHASQAQGMHPLAAGQLMPVGNGYGLRIERLLGLKKTHLSPCTAPLAKD
jgi:hypothetical protein